MNRTYCVAEMKFTDVTALSDATVESSCNQSFGNTDIFKKETDQEDYGTFELNQFVLDGSKSILPEAPGDIAFWSSEMSKDDLSFEQNPKIQVVFKENHSSVGLTLYFADDYPTELKITWYTLAGTALTEKTFYPDNLTYTCLNQVENYGKIIIEFIRTRNPRRYIKLQYILYGRYISWSDDLIQTGKVYEEIDETSATLTIITAEIAIVAENNDFDIENEAGAWKSVQKTQEVNVTEYVNGKTAPMGTFFINEFSFSDNVASFKLIDAIGLMDQYIYYNGEIYVDKPAGQLLTDIFAAAKITKYHISEEVAEIKLTGYLGIQTCRAALQMVCFACGAITDDSRSDTISIYKPDRYAKYTVTAERKFFGGTEVTLDKYVSGVSIECSKYDLEADMSEIYKDTMLEGRTKIEFSEPYLASSIQVSAGTVVEVKTNYLVIDMPETGTCTITGRKYVSSKFSYQKNVEKLEAGESENQKKYGTCTLYNMELLPELADRLLKYHALRKKVDLEYLLDREQVGNWININSVTGKMATTLLESQTLDLSGGFIAAASCRGYSVTVTASIFAGTELYTGGDVLI